MKNVFKYNQEFILENNNKLPDLEIAYNCYGKLNKQKDNVIWVCHALTANSNIEEWWPGMLGKGKLFDTDKYFIICANIPGSCYGSTGPLSVNTKTGDKYYHDFPQFTVRDIIKAFELLRKHIGISKINTIIGGSIGAFQALEWSIMYADLIKNLVFIASDAKATPWIIAFNESQRMAIKTDKSFMEKYDKAGSDGLKTARSIALLTYRNANTYNLTQTENSNEKTSDFRAASYQRYQGEKLAKRFNAFSYYTLSLLMDSHNVARERESIKHALSLINANTLLIGISSDIMFPVENIIEMNKNIRKSRYIEIESLYGHDGFLIEVEKLSKEIKKFIK